MNFWRSFLDGFSRVLDIGQTSYRQLRVLTPEEGRKADADALKQDWEKILGKWYKEGPKVIADAHEEERRAGEGVEGATKP
jgi:hypothetical protein